MAIGLGVIMALLWPKPDTNESPILEIKEETKETFIYIDIGGEVNNPGVYKVEENTRLFYIVDMAGGLTSEADINAVNLSILVYDQMKIYIPSFDDDMPNIVEEQEDTGLININTAGPDVLMSLPGIGPATAQNIIDYRDNVGLFNSVEDIMNVENIGESTFASIKDFITVS